MHSLRFLSLLLAFGFLSACGDLGPTASEEDPPCDTNPAEYAECEDNDDDDDDGYIGSGS